MVAILSCSNSKSQSAEAWNPTITFCQLPESYPVMKYFVKKQTQTDITACLWTVGDTKLRVLCTWPLVLPWRSIQPGGTLCCQLRSWRRRGTAPRHNTTSCGPGRVSQADTDSDNKSESVEQKRDTTALNASVNIYKHVQRKDRRRCSPCSSFHPPQRLRCFPSCRSHPLGGASTHTWPS